MYKSVELCINIRDLSANVILMVFLCIFFEQQSEFKRPSSSCGANHSSEDKPPNGLILSIYFIRITLILIAFILMQHLTTCGEQLF